MDKKISALIVDDNVEAINILKILLNEYENIELKASFTSPHNALNWLNEQSTSGVNTIFLDLEMDEMHGLNVAEKINDINPNINIVFVTSFAEFAVQAFELNSLDYIIKPATRARMNKTIERLTESLKTVKVHKKPEPGKLPDKVYIQYLKEFNINVASEQGEIYLEFPTNPIKETCAFLAHHLGQWVKREQIINSIWPDKDYEKSRVKLYSHIYEIKKAFLNIGFNDVVQSSKLGYRLIFSQESIVETDISGLEELLKAQITISPDNIDKFEKDIEVYKSAKYMGTNYYNWTAEKQYQINAGIHKLLKKIALYYQKRNELIKLEALYKKAIDYTLEIDWAYFELIKLHLQQGRKPEAMRTYLMLKAELKSELGVEPDDKIKSLLNKYELL